MTRHGTNFVTLIDTKDKYDNPKSCVVVKPKPCRHIIKSEQKCVFFLPKLTND